jgi:hypothetical protein
MVSQWATVSSITVNGTSTGSITGYISDPATNSFNFGTTLAKGAATIFGAVSGSSFVSLAGDQGGLTSAVSGVVKDFLNGVFGGTSVTVHPVNLTMNTSINLGGSLVTNGGLENMKLVLPGQSNSQTADGNTPGYDSPLGIFTIVNKPKVHSSSTSYSTGPWSDPEFGYTYNSDFVESTFTLDDNSYSITWNTSVINSVTSGATIQNLKKQVVVLNDNLTFFPESNPQDQYDAGSPGAGAPYTEGFVPTAYGTTEIIGKYNAAVGFNATTPLIVDFVSAYAEPTVVGVRISFDVVPNNGGPRATIVKTFPATLVN